jgi:predicted PurR-regulated permease PerM
MVNQRLSDGARLVLFLAFIFGSFTLIGYFLRPILSALGLSIVLSYLLSKPIQKIEFYTGLGRNRIIVAVLFTIFLCVILAGVFVAPPVYKQLIQLIEKIPNAVYTFQTVWIPHLLNKLSAFGFEVPSSLGAEIRNFQVANQIESRLTSGLTAIWESAPILLSTLINGALIPPFTYLLLVHQKRTFHFVQDLVPRGLLSPIRRLALTADEALQAVIKGHLSVAAILAVLYTFGLGLVGLPFGFAIGIISGACRIIPYGDLIVAVSLSAIAILTSPSAYDSSLGIAVFSVILGIQILDALFVTPKIIGGRLGLHPVISIAAIISLGGVFGFWGVMLAIPSAALIQQAWRGLIPLYIDSKFYRE